MTNNRMFEQDTTTGGVVLATSAYGQAFDAEAFKRETGWDFGDAVDMAAEIRRENRIFGKPGQKHRPRRRRGGFDHARFERETGMTYGDALEMAIDHRREERWFGSRH